MSNPSRVKSIMMILIPVLVLVSITLFSVLNRINQARVMQQRLENPQMGDVILVHTDDQPARYFYIKLYRVEENRIYYYQSPWDYEKIPREMKRNDGFVARSLLYNRAKFDSLREQGYFIRLVRDYPEKSSYNKLFSQDEWPQ